jgi:ElaB/YqjD/DUF883 family membrane-anchored ribosome-binding protein
VGQGPDEIRERTIVVGMPQAHAEQAEREPRSGGDVGDESDLDETTAAAREEIELTRADMTSTIEAIQERLDPEVLSEQAKDTAHDVTDYAIREVKDAAREITDHALAQAREAVRDVTGQAKLAVREATIGKVEHMARTASNSAGGFRDTVVETIKANPMPAALVGLGIGWMFLNRPSGPTSERYGSSSGQGYRTTGYNPGGYGASPPARGGVGAAADAAQQTVGHVVDRAQETAGQVVEQVQDTAGQAVEQVQQTAGQVMGQVQETGGQLVDQVQEQASRAQSFLERQLEENPLLVGAVALVIGAVLGGTVQPTPREDQLLGSTRDRLMGSAKELTQETMHKVGRVVDEAQSAAKQEAREQSLVPEGGAQGSNN